MTSPRNATTGISVDVAVVTLMASVALHILRKRADFLKAARAAWRSTPGFSIQARERGTEEAERGIRVGYTCSKKVGNAVARNRAKRRLRAIVRDILAEHGRDGWDYVLIGKSCATADRAFALMGHDLKTALASLHPVQP